MTLDLRWEGIIAVEGVATEDRRLIQPGGLYWDVATREPLPLLTLPRDDIPDGPIGEITELHRLGHLIWASGNLVPEWRDRMDPSWRPGQRIGLAVDLDRGADFVSDEELMVFQHHRILGAHVSAWSAWSIAQVVIIQEMP